MTGNTTGGNGEIKRSLLPGWRWVKLGEICEVVSKGTTPTSLGHSFTQFGIPFLRAEDVRGRAITPENVSYYISNSTNDLLARSKLKPRDFLITIAGTLGRVGYISDDATPMNCNQAVAFARLHAEIADVQFICYACQSEDIIAPLKILKAGGSVQNLNLEQVRSLRVPIPPLPEQKRIAAMLNEQMVAVDRVRAAAEAQLKAAKALPVAFIKESFNRGSRKKYRLADCLFQITNGVGASWSKYQLLGATRAGLAPAKEVIGKKPERYKLVEEGTIFYNPMRILLGSIAIVDEGDAPGITSPDYVVFKSKEGLLHPRWFYYWLRSPYGDSFIKTLSRGAVRERMLFRRLAAADVELPTWDQQLQVAEKMKHIKIMETIIKEDLNLINALPASLLRRAFNGEM